MDVQANRPECIPDPYLVRELNGFTEIRRVDRHFIVKGLRGGSAWLVGPMNSVILVVEAPPCTSMTLTYPKVMKRRTRAWAEVSYLPEGCTRPDSGATFVSDSPQTFLVEDTHHRGTIRARDLDSKNPGVATITVTHGQLKASTVVAIESD